MREGRDESKKSGNGYDESNLYDSEGSDGGPYISSSRIR